MHYKLQDTPNLQNFLLECKNHLNELRDYKHARCATNIHSISYFTCFPSTSMSAT